MKKSLWRTIILTEALILTGLAILIFLVSVQDWRYILGARDARIPIEQSAAEAELALYEIGSLGPSDESPVGPEESDNLELSSDFPELFEASDTLTPTPTPFDCGPTEGWVIYKVLDEDTLAGLLESTGAALAEFQKVNCLGDSTVIVPGMSLFFPSIPLKTPAAPPKSTDPSVPTAVPAKIQEPTELPVESLPTTLPETNPEGRNGGDWVWITPGRVNGYLARSGAGWQYYYSSPVDKSWQTVAYGERDAMSWDLLNPAEGEYNWNPIYTQLNYAKNNWGDQFSFRVYSSADSPKVPQWALNAGVKVLANGEIDYANCVYQEKWGKFVNAMVAEFDGNPDIAFIDISGYSDYNEWAWEEQTEWDYLWAERYEAGTASAASMSTMDSYARRRLADMFIGGSFQGHQCRMPGGGTATVNYSYQGFQDTQLVLPYAGIRQTTQYVFLRRADVGFRHDGWGRESSNGIYSGLQDELDVIWRHAPVVLEATTPSQFVYSYAKLQVKDLHGTIFHNPKVPLTAAEIADLVGNTGYRYALLGAGYDSVVTAGGSLEVQLGWRNIGNMPAYLSMGQTFKVFVYLIDQNDKIVKTYQLADDVASWVPGYNSKDVARGTETSGFMPLPINLSPGQYQLRVAIVHDWTGKPIDLDADLNVVNGLYLLGPVTVNAP